jgi:acyl transferase domain-containing protein
MRSSDHSVAIIGMAGRFPGAATLDAFWSNLRAGVESIEFFQEKDREPGPLDGAFGGHGSLVCAAGVLKGIENFDAELFGFSPREAAVLDPQHRIFLECAWEAMENAGHFGARFPGAIGVFAGCGANTYLLNLLSHPEILAVLDPRQLVLANDKDYLSSRVSYRLGLTGPSLTVQTACSTSLVAVHQACQSLLNGECDLAIAGGVSLRIPQRAGYYYIAGGIESRDGHCRAFDARASGTVPSSGAGVVILRRAADAIDARDHIRALIRGSAVNNDGARRAGYTAPSASGQAAVIAEAMAVAGVSAEQIGLVETHGTGTLLGDPIEAAALAEIFRTKSPSADTCAIGSVKTNIGHLDAAAGVAGLIKAVLALEHAEIPPSLNFEIPNPNIDLKSSRLEVARHLRSWPRGNASRCAGVSSFGIGGTNAHVVLQEAPQTPARRSSHEWHLLPVSAASPAALDRACLSLSDRLASPEVPNLADTAFTLQTGRAEMAYRRAVVCRSPSEGAELLKRRAKAPARAHASPQVVFLFPGQGVQRFGMGRELYSAQPVFRTTIDACCEILLRTCGLDLRYALVGDAVGEQFRDTDLVQPSLFVFEYALAKLWMSWGVTPVAMAGHSLGEYVVACVAGVLTVENALHLVAERGRLMGRLPPGRMLAVGLAEADTRKLLPEALEIAAVNAPDLCVVAGPPGPVAYFAAELERKHVFASELRISHAFHSRMMEAAVLPLVQLAQQTEHRRPTIPYVSNVTGRWITENEFLDPAYWGRHLCSTVQFASSMVSLNELRDAIFIELGPDSTLGGLVRSNFGLDARMISSIGAVNAGGSVERQVLAAVGTLWEYGGHVDFTSFDGQELCRRTPLPSYPFERRRHWVELQQSATPRSVEAAPLPVAKAISPSASRPLGEAGEVTETERILVSIWEETLGPWSGNLQDNFFDLHGDSLVATKIMSRIRDGFGCNLSIREFFEDPTISALARLIDGATREEARQLPMVAQPPGTSRTASFAQQRLWFMDRLQSGTPAYNIVLAIRVTGALDRVVLSRALAEVVARHEVLRTSFPTIDGLPVPVVAPANPVDLAVIDLTSSTQSEDQLHRILRDESVTPLDLSVGPLCKLKLVRMAPGDHVLSITVHHIVFDVWSSAVLFSELGQLYQAFVRGEDSPLSPLALQYADFAAWQKALFESGWMQRQAAYWVRKLGKDVPRVMVPPDKPVPRKRGWAGAIERARVGNDLSERIRSKASREGVTPFMLLLAAYFVILHHRIKNDVLVVGTDIANRNHQNTEQMIGFFVNQLVLKIDLSDNPGVSAIVSRVRELTLEAFAHQDLPFDRLVDLMQPRRISGDWPLFGVKFVMRNVPMPKVEIAGLTFESVPIELHATTFDFVLTAAEEAGGFSLGLEYATELYSGQTICDVLEDYVGVLDELIRDDRITLGDLEQRLADAERDRSCSRAMAADQSLARARRRPISFVSGCDRSLEE